MVVEQVAFKMNNFHLRRVHLRRYIYLKLGMFLNKYENILNCITKYITCNYSIKWWDLGDVLLLINFGENENWMKFTSSEVAKVAYREKVENCSFWWCHMLSPAGLPSLLVKVNVSACMEKTDISNIQVPCPDVCV